ncbi:MAG: EutN/CcmL family microcompartment protein [Muricoprocola sp.]
MRMARVVGNVVSTVKDEGYNGKKLMLVEYFDPVSQNPEESRMIAIDCADAGIGDIVLVSCNGRAGNILLEDNHVIVDLVICGIVDSYTVYGETTVV